MNSNNRMRGAGAAVVAIALASSAALAGGKTEFTPFNSDGFVPINMSADGTTVVGTAYFGAPGFYWNENDGVVTIGGGCGAGEFDISGDGSTIVGCTIDENGKQVAAKWLGGEDWQSLGSVAGAVSCDASLSSSWGIDYYGHAAVGLAWLAQQCRAHAGAWDLLGGGPATDLGSFFPNSASRANGISGDGHTIIGWQDNEFGERQGAKWVDGVESYVLTNSGEHVGEVSWTNFDGTAMCGSNYPWGSGDAWVWTAAKGFTAIATGPVYVNNVVAIAASDDGSVTIGVARTPTGTPRGWFFSKGKFTWMDDYMSKKHFAAGWSSLIPTAISADGSVLAGQGITPDGRIDGWIIKNF